MDKKETLLLKIESDNKNFKKITAESIKIIDSLGDAVQKFNNKLTKPDNKDLWATKKLRELLGIVEKPIAIKIDDSKVNSILNKLAKLNEYLKSIKSNSKIDFNLSGLDSMSKNKSIKINIKGEEKLPKIADDLAKVIVRLTKLKEIGKNIGLNFDGIKDLADVTAKLERLEKKIKKIKEEAKDTNDTSFADVLGKRFIAANVAANLLSATLRSFLIEIKNTIRDLSSDMLKFEDSIYKARGALGDNLGNFKETSQEVIALSKELGKNVSDVAKGIGDTYRAGIGTADDALKAFKYTAIAAKAMQSDFTDTLNLGVLAINNYGASLDDLPTIYNKVFVAANMSKLDPADFTKQFAGISTVAGQVNLSMNESLSMFSAFGNSLRNASDASVAFRNFIGKIISPADHMKKKIAEINEETKGIGKDIMFSASGIKDVDGTLEGFLKNFQVKIIEYARKNKKDVQDELGTLFVEKNAQKGIQQAYRALFLGVFDEIHTELKKNTTALENAYDEVTSGILERWERFTTDVKANFYQIFVNNQDDINGMLDSIEGVINDIIFYFDELKDSFSWFSSLSESFPIIANGIKFVFSFIITVVAELIKGITKGVSAILQLVSFIDNIANSMATALGNIPKLWQRSASENIKAIKDWFKSQFDAFKKNAVLFAKNVASFFGMGFLAIGKGIVNGSNSALGIETEKKKIIDSNTKTKAPPTTKKDFIPAQTMPDFRDGTSSPNIDEGKAEKARKKAIENIKDDYETKLKIYQREKNEIVKIETEKGSDKESIALKTNTVLNKIALLQSKTAKSLLAYDLKEHESFKEKASDTEIEIQNNIKDFEKRSLEDRLKIKNKIFNEEKEKIDFNAEKFKLSEIDKTDLQIKNNEDRIKDINNFLSKDTELRKNKYKETRSELEAERKKLLQQNELNLQKIGEANQKKTIEIERDSLNQKKSIIDFEEQYRLDSSKNLINKRRALVQEEITFAKKELSNIPDSDWQSKGNKKAEIFAMEKFILPGLDNAEIQLARQLENQRHQDKIDNLNRESELNKINTYQALDLEKQLNSERLATLDYRLSKEVNEEEKANIIREKKALEHANRLIDIAKTNEMLNDISKINTAFANISKTFIESSSEMMKGIGSIIEPLSKAGDKIIDITKKVQSNDTLGIVTAGVQESVTSITAYTEAMDKLNKVVGSSQKTEQDINEARLEYWKSYPIIGDAVYTIFRKISDAMGNTLPESVKKARKEIQELLKQIGKYENEKNITSTEQKIKFIEKERDEQLKTIDLVSEGGAEFLAKYMKTWNDYFEKIANLQKEISQAEKDSTWENTLAKIASQEDTFQNKMALIDLEEKREIEKARENYKSEKQLLLDINTIELKSEKQRNNLRKEESEKEKEQTEKLSETRTEMYEKELDMIDKIYGKHKEKLAGEIEGFQQKIKELTQQIQDVESEFYDNRAKEAEKTSQRYSVFTSALSQRKGDLAPSFFRANQLEMDIRSSLESSKAQEEYERTGNFVQYQARMAKMALDKFAYLQNKLNDTIDPQERADMEKELISIRQEYYNFAFDKEKEAMEEKKRQLEEEKKDNEAKLLQKQAEIDKVTKAELAALDQVNKAYEQSGNYWLTTMINRTNTWMDYAKTQAKDLFSESKDEVGKLFQEFEKIKAKVFSEISGKTSNTSTSSGGGGSFNQINTNAPAYTSSSSTVSTPSLSSSSAPFAVGLNAMLGQINNSSSNPAPGSSNVIDPDIQKANVIRDIARNNPGFSEQYFFDKYFSFPLETIRDVARQQMIKGYYKNGTPYVPEDGTYYLHQGERVLTEKENRNYSSQNMVVNFYNQISGVKLDSSENIQKAVNNLESNMTRQLQKEMRVNNTL